MEIGWETHEYNQSKIFHEIMNVYAPWNDILCVLDCLLLNFDLIYQFVYIVFDIKLSFDLVHQFVYIVFDIKLTLSGVLVIFRPTEF